MDISHLRSIVFLNEKVYLWSISISILRVPSHESVLRCIIMRSKEAKIYFFLFHSSYDASQNAFIRRPPNGGHMFMDNSHGSVRAQSHIEENRVIEDWGSSIQPMRYSPGLHAIISLVESYCLVPLLSYSPRHGTAPSTKLGVITRVKETKVFSRYNA